MYREKIEDEAIIWTRGLVALGAGPYLLIANIPYLNVAAVWVTASSANFFLGFSGIEGYELGSVLVDTGIKEVNWSDWNGNRWILTEQLGEAGFFIPLIKEVDGTTEVGFVMACSAMQSMAVFIGALWAIRTAPWRRRMRAAIVTIPTIFVLNTFRNAGIVWLHASYPQWDLLGVTMFDFAHYYAAKVGSLAAMFLMALVIFDLLPQVHRKAYTPNKNTIQIDFLVKNKGKTTAAGHFGKSVKGEFVRFLAQNQVKSIKEFKGFEYDGFKWDGKNFVKNT